MSEVNWWESSPEMTIYYESEWGFPEHNDQKLFEILSLEIMQAGLSWNTVFKKRANFRQAFYDFEIKKVAAMTSTDIDRLMGNPGLIRHRQKLAAIINNAQMIQKFQQAGQSFDHFVWQSVNFQVINHHPQTMAEVPTVIFEAKQLAKQLKKAGFKFVGPTTCYSFMQAAGLVCDRINFP
ncbi:DNA-3-methyladenine glycosylase I [Lactobacillus sp. 3B(2020)]|uniref:DNA-3-methyladenine glycosylase I n=1 Tax=Lactobacillus sp. 3B(2020) TaxID=2695882 RepID=UPI0015DF2CC3|nr:DNA-3-methyladenine glycosylase I [Lactobacillus sp. 3B(2020)]QLL69368.1 DNA-3-methyladenine glycosylase I [Lactobacillus sp. 3B(2020)]